MSRSRVVRVGVTVVVLAVVGIFFGRTLAANWSAVQQIELQVDGWSAAAVLLFALAVVLSGVLWGSMLEHLGETRVGMLEAVRVQCASWLLKYIPGQVGSVANKVVWAAQRGISRTLVAITFVYENVFLLIGSIVPTVVILFFADAFDDDGQGAFARVLPALLALLPLLLVAETSVFRRAVGVVGRRVLKREVPAEYFLGRRAALGYQLAFLGPRVLNGLGFVCVVASFLPVPASAYLPLAAAYVLAGAIGILAVFVPSGLGVREGVIVLFASRYMPLEQAVVLSLVARLYSTLADGVVAALYGALRFRTVPKGDHP